MSERCGELARQYFERFWNQRDLAAFDELSDANAVAYQPDGAVTSARQLRDVEFPELLKAIPDLQIHVEDVITSGDNAVVRWKATGKHTGDGMGFKASRQSIAFAGMTWLVFRDEKITTGWNCWDQGGLMKALSEGSLG